MSLIGRLSSQAPYPDGPWRASSGNVPDRSIPDRNVSRGSASKTPSRENWRKWVGVGREWLIKRITGEYEHEVTHWWQNLELTLDYGRISAIRRHGVPGTAPMNIIWYPGCGQDSNPILTLLRSNRCCDHVPQQGPKDEGPILWMTDYYPEVIRCFDRLKPRKRLPVSAYRDRDGRVCSLRIRVKGRDRRELKDDAVRIRYVRHPRRKLEGAEKAKKVSAERWVTKFGAGPNDLGNCGNSPEEIKKRPLLKLLKELEGENSRNEQAILMVNQELAKFPQPPGNMETQPPLSVRWDVTELILETRRETSPTAEQMRVWFSPIESEAALKYVYGPRKVRLHCVVLVRLGGFSCQRPELDHHDRRYFELLSEHAEATGTGLPDYVLTDKDTSRWGDPDPYVPTGVAYQGWMGLIIDGDPGVRLFRKRVSRPSEDDHRGR